MSYVENFFKRRKAKIHDYQAAYERQKKRSDMLMIRVDNLKKEQERRDDIFYKTIKGLDPFWRGWTREELNFLHTELIELFVNMRPLMGCEYINHGIGNIAAGYSPDGQSQLDMQNKDVQNIRAVAETMHKIMLYMDWSDD
jgi:hypothetical protein